MPITVAYSKGEGEVKTALLYGDTHFPNHDPRALAIVGQIAAELKPHVLVHMGDLLDCYLLSRFDKNPERMESLQDEINMARQHLAQMCLLTPNSHFILLEGNHEDRLRRTLWNLEGTAKALTSLTNFRKSLTWPSLLGLSEMRITFAPYDGTQSKHKFLPKWILKHGTIVRKFSGYTARGEMEKYGRSGSSGHTHRLGAHYHQDHNGNHCWVETGCTCSLNPEYMVDPDWQQGCVVLTFEPTTGAFQAEPIYIHNGLAVWRGRVYRV
jgi:predicted phosphodiesterase